MCVCVCVRKIERMRRRRVVAATGLPARFAADAADESTNARAAWDPSQLTKNIIGRNTLAATKKTTSIIIIKKNNNKKEKERIKNKMRNTEIESNHTINRRRRRRHYIVVATGVCTAHRQQSLKKKYQIINVYLKKKTDWYCVIVYRHYIVISYKIQYA